METKVFSGTLGSGIPYEVHTLEGFSGHSEVALKVEGEIVSITSIELKRTGSIFCRPINPGKVVIKREFKEKDVSAPNLDDVIHEP